jgi:hypothetical protein
MCCPAAPEAKSRRESALFWGEMSPSGGQNEQKGHREGRIAALLPRTLGPGVNGAALLPSRSDSWPRLTYQSGCICPTTEPVSRGCAWCMVFVHLFRNAPTGLTLKGWSAEGPKRARCDRALESLPHRLSGKRQSLPFGYVLPGSPRRATKAGKRALGRENEPFGRSK